MNVKSEHERRQQRELAIVIASERKNTPVTPVKSVSGRNTITGVIVEPIIGTCDLGDLPSAPRCDAIRRGAGCV